MVTIDKSEAIRIKAFLTAAPVAPGIHSHFINVGTDQILETLEDNYFKEEMPLGISCFKYLQGYYGSGKTQFINSLAARAWQNNVVTSIASVGAECPFNSPLAIYQSIVRSMFPPPKSGYAPEDDRGIEVIFRNYIHQKLHQYGIEDGQSVPSEIKIIIEQPFSEMYIGAPDMQTAIALQHLGRTMLSMACGGTVSPADFEIISWLRGDDVKSKHMKDLGLQKPAKDDNAFNRLKTIIMFMSKRMGVKGFFIAFDEGYRTASFRRGSVKQNQAIENLLSMINDGADGRFPGVMFMYAATPDFRNEVIRKYPALNDRIGDIAFKPGSPMVPFIDLDALDTDLIVRQLGKRLLAVFGVALDTKWDMDVQTHNIDSLLDAEKSTFGFGSEIRRAFVYHFCIILSTQKNDQHKLSADEMRDFIQNHVIPSVNSDGEE